MLQMQLNQNLLLLHTLEARKKMLNTFKILWFEEYLLGLRESRKDLHESEFHNRIREEVVIMKKPSQTQIILEAAQSDRVI